MRSIPTFKKFLYESERFTGDLTQEQIDFLNQFVKHKYYYHGNEPGEWTVNPDTGLVDVNGRFEMNGVGAKDFKGIKFGTVLGGFDCSENELTSLEGCPIIADGGFRCYKNKLTSLVGGPKESKYSYHCGNNLLTSLEGIPTKIRGSFKCSVNQITSLKEFSGVEWIDPDTIDISNNSIKVLEFLPDSIDGWFDCSNNQLTSLKGSPKKVKSLYYCSTNHLESLDGCPEEVEVFSCHSNKLKSLEGGPKRAEKYRCSYNPLVSLKGAPIEVVDFEFDSIKIKEGEWNLATFFDILSNGSTREKELIETIIDTSDEALDSYFTENPLDLYVLDPFPELKAGVLKRTGMKDLSKMGRNLKSGLI